MKTYQVNILNPKAARLLQDLADLNLISIKQTSEETFIESVTQLRTKASIKPPSFEDITKEVESVRAKRYAQNK